MSIACRKGRTNDSRNFGLGVYVWVWFYFWLCGKGQKANKILTRMFLSFLTEGPIMDARLQFEWSNDKAKKFVDHIQNAGFLGQGYDDIANRDDATYEVTLQVTLKHRRKKRKKSDESEGLDL